jgi:hypothetical protein
LRPFAFIRLCILETTNNAKIEKGMAMFSKGPRPKTQGLFSHYTLI